MLLTPETVLALRPTAPEVFFSRYLPDDPRLGELVLRGIPTEAQRLDAVFLGIPQDLGVIQNAGRPGAAEAPAAIRSAFYRLTPDTGTSAGLDQLSIADLGDIDPTDKSLEELHALQERCISELLIHAPCVIVLGGGHDIAYPNAAALLRHSPCGILVFDAHPDVRPRIDGKPHSGSAFRQLLEELRFPAERLAYIGLQPYAIAREHREYLQQRGAHLCFLPELLRRGMASVLPELFAAISDGGQLPVYVSIDMDAIPAAFAPGVSAPATIGIPPEQLLWAAHFLGSSPNVRLLDIAELNPRYDLDHRTARLAALILATFLAGLLQRPQSSASTENS
ncbi:MAG: formimidoylglutamase [Candidatus Kapabacteria bacterium]|nr:formimidoylglutamase [Candidatus Kapabacteria bacterium]MDW8012977.1 formimidoylglutamase [Bacteroidota bacterium]